MDAPPRADIEGSGLIIVPDHGFEVPEEMLALLKAELEPGERLLWVGRPKRKSSLAGSDWLQPALWAVGFGVLSVVCLAVVAPEARFRSVEGFATIVGLIAGIIGFFVVIGTIAAALESSGVRRAKGQALYALTDRRAIIRKPVVAGHKKGGVEVHSIWCGQVERLHRVEYSDSSGDLIFHLNERHQLTDPLALRGFEDVPEVRRVEDLARHVLIERPAD